jgi:hypothetical protein
LCSQCLRTGLLIVSGALRAYLVTGLFDNEHNELARLVVRGLQFAKSGKSGHYVCEHIPQRVTLLTRMHSPFLSLAGSSVNGSTLRITILLRRIRRSRAP